VRVARFRPAFQRHRIRIALGAAAALLLVACTFKPVVQHDGIGYFVYLHSVVVDHDLDLSDEYAAAARAHIPGSPPTERTATGLRPDFFPVGPAVLSLPAYLLALASHPTGEPQFGWPFTLAFVLASLLYGLLALALTYRLARAVLGSPRAAALGVLATAFATSFFYYLLYEPSYSHTFSAFMVTGFLYYWWRTRDGRSRRAWLVLGVLGGLMALTRWQDGPLLAITLLDLRRARWRLLLLVPGVLLAFSPQLWTDHVLFGSWLPDRPPREPLQWWPGHYLDVLFSTNRGLFVWTPIMVAAVVGFLLLPDRKLKLAALYALLVETVINGTIFDWWGGYSFGMRRFLGLTPFIAIGLGALALRLRPRMAWAAAVGLAAWNFVLIANMTYLIGDRDPGLLGLLTGQLQALAYVPRLLVQGYAIRALAAWPLLQTAPDVLGGTVLLGGELLGLAIPLWLVLTRPREGVAATHRIGGVKASVNSRS
jgi:hypothetical protein